MLAIKCHHTLYHNSTVFQAAATWANSDSSTGQQHRQHSKQEVDQPAASSTNGSAFAQQPSLKKGHAPETPLPEEAESPPADQQMSYQEEQDVIPRASVEQYSEALGNEAAAEADSMPGPSDKTAANLSKALRKMQAESAVLQEHSRRLQEKAVAIQQQRASADQVHIHSNTQCCATFGSGQLSPVMAFVPRINLFMSVLMHACTAVELVACVDTLTGHHDRQANPFIDMGG